MWTKEEKEICFLIWGAVPLDIQWAKNTQVWKSFKI